MKSFLKFLIEELIPNHKNTYYDEEGKWRWLSNHKLVSKKWNETQIPKYIDDSKYIYKPLKPIKASENLQNLETIFRYVLWGHWSLEDFLEKCSKEIKEIPWLRNLFERVSGVSSDDYESLSKKFIQQTTKDLKDTEKIDTHTLFKSLRDIMERGKAYKDFFGSFENPEDAKKFQENFEEKLKESVSEKETSVTINIMASSLIKVLSSKRFKTQFESKKSNGYLDYGTRNSLEIVNQGYDPQRPLKEHPIYGGIYKVSKDKPESSKNTIISGNFDFNREKFVRPEEVFESSLEETYGCCTVVLDDSVRERCLVTFGDSLDFTLPSSPLNKPSIYSTNFIKTYCLDDEGYLEGKTKNPNLTKEEVQEEADFKDNSEDSSKYIEVQIQNGLSVSDIDYVIVDYAKMKSLNCDRYDLDKKRKTDYKYYEKLIELLKENEVPYIIIDDGIPLEKHI